MSDGVPRGGKYLRRLPDGKGGYRYIYDEPKGKETPGGKHDEHGADELHLHADNTYAHHGQKEAIRDNLARKMAAGKYDHSQAVKLWQYHADAASQSYKKEHGSAGGTGGHAFDIHTRREVAHRMADDFLAEAKHGEHDDRVSSGVHKKRAPNGLKPIASQHTIESQKSEAPVETPAAPATGVEIPDDVRRLSKAEALTALRRMVVKSDQGGNPIEASQWGFAIAKVSTGGQLTKREFEAVYAEHTSGK